MIPMIQRRRSDGERSEKHDPTALKNIWLPGLFISTVMHYYDHPGMVLMIGGFKGNDPLTRFRSAPMVHAKP